MLILFTTVSPGLIPRPLLSDAIAHARDPSRGGVAGVNPPAFVERSGRIFIMYDIDAVSPGLIPRPLLSAVKKV